MPEWLLPTGRYLVTGFGTTLLIASLSVVLATPLGIAIGIMTQNSHRLASLLARGYIETLRGVPSLMTLLFVFFALPRLGIETGPITASVIGLGFWSAANIGEGVRGALSSIPTGQIIAARALGMTQIQTILLVIFPQALRRFLPPYVGQMTILIQASTLTSVVGVTDLLGSARQMIERLTYVSDSSHAVLIYGFVMALFFVVCYPLTVMGKILEDKVRSS